MKGFTYIVFNKPFEVLSQFTTDGNKTTLKEYIDIPNVYPCGRLDYDSEGLMLLTDDAKFQHQVSHPKHKMEKTYLAQVDGEITTEAVDKLKQGVEIKGGTTLPAKAIKVDEPKWLWERSKPVRYRKEIPTSWVEIKITQGMNRQVRKMCAAVGFPCLRLIRTQIGGYKLGDLEVGKWRKIERMNN